MTGVQDNSSPPPHERGSARFFGRRRTLQTPSEALQPEAVPPPPKEPNSEQRPILSAISGFLSFSLVAAIVGLIVLSFAGRLLASKGPLAADKIVYIAPGTEVVQIIDTLEKEGVIDQPTLVKGTLWTQRKWRKVKAGEYLFPAHISHADVINKLVSGKQVLHSVTIPEGLTSLQIIERLRANKVLAGDIREIPPEGSLLPETYKVARGNSRAQLIRKMTREQDKLLTRIWNKRAKNLPLKTKYELVTLAAIVEKETGRADERSRVAGVFFNRLRKGMRLQSDPTIVYGLVGGKGTLGRSILRSEIRKPTAYNTYVIPALPPGPIANPGRAALEATANPSQTNDLFFVADGTGGHAFAPTLAEHNRNVKRWREIEKERAAGKAGGAEKDGKPESGAGVDRVAPEPEAPPEPKRRGRRGNLFQISPFFGPAVFARGVTGKAISPVETAAARLLLADALRRKPVQSMLVLASSRLAEPAEISPAKAKPVTSKPVQKPIASKTNEVKPEASKKTAAGSALAAVNSVVVQPDAGAHAKPVLPENVSAYASYASKNVPQRPASTKIASATAGTDKALNEKTAIAPVQGGTTKKTMEIKLAPGIEALNLQIIGVTPDVTDSPLDGPIFMDTDDGEPAAVAGKIPSAPMSSAKRADMAARIAKYATSMPFQSGDIETRAQEIPDLGPAPGKNTKAGKGLSGEALAGNSKSAGKNTRTARLQPVRRKVYDASAGTKFDPLKSKRWDLNSAKVIPRLR